MTLVLRYAARSDRGLVRSNNEDSVYAGARLLALADGMGGHAAGEVASQLMIAALAHLDDDEPGPDLLGKLEAATREGNASIAEQVEEDPELDGMGTTLTAILFGGKKIGLIHIGDSRAYLMRDGELTQITRDDTFVQSLVDEGRITAEQAHSHPQRSLIMRALTGHEIEPTLTVREARAGDRYLLCSDGLSDPVSSETISDTMKEGANDECADRLIELALRSGGPDNVTVVVADVIDLDYGQSRPIVGGAASPDDEDDAPPPNTAAGRAAAMRPPRTASKRVAAPAPPPPEKKSHKLRWSLIALAAILVVAAGGTFGYYLLRTNYYVGDNEDRIAVMRGLPGSVFGFSLNEVDLVGCIQDTATEPATVDQPETSARTIDFFAPTQLPDGCRVLGVDDLQPSAREQVRSGLPSGTLDETKAQVSRLATGDLLPLCSVATTTTEPAPSDTAIPETATIPAPFPSAVPLPPPVPAEPTVTATPLPTQTPIPGISCRSES